MKRVVGAGEDRAELIRDLDANRRRTDLWGFVGVSDR
jgi:hypothetical protein